MSATHNSASLVNDDKTSLNTNFDAQLQINTSALTQANHHQSSDARMNNLSGQMSQTQVNSASGQINQSSNLATNANGSHILNQNGNSNLTTYSQSFKPQMHVENQFLPSKGHPLQTNWKFWYFQRFFAPSNLTNQSSAGNSANFGSNTQSQDPTQIQNSYALNNTQNDSHKKNKFVDYREKLKDMGQISTIEQFFQYFVYMKKPSEMPREIDLFFFRENEIPMWEESPNGGIWIVKIKKEDNIDKMWEVLLLALISEQFEEPKVIGLGLSLRTKERLVEIWLKDGRNDKVRTNVSNKLRQLLGLDPSSVTLYYKEHQKSIKDQSTMKNAEGFKFMKADGNRSRQPHINSSNTAPYKGVNMSSNINNGEGETGGFRKKSNQFGNIGATSYGNQQHHPQSSNNHDKPFSHLGANYQGDDRNRVYRMKAPSHI
eukprot:403371728